MLAVQFRLQIEQNARLAQANSELDTGRQQFEAVLSNITQGVGFFDGEQRLVLCNRRYAEIYELPLEITRPGSSWADIVAYRTEHGSAPDVAPSTIQRWHEQIMTLQPPDGGVVPLQNGRFVAVNHQTMPDGGWVATHEDVTLRQQAEASIAFMAHHDALTKLPNRVLFQDRMEQAIALADRGIRFAVFCLDLDRFKQVNDAMGHPVGDGLLVAVADRLQACVRDTDTVARLGGDEFAIVQLDLQQP